MTGKQEGSAMSYKWQRTTGGWGSELPAVKSYEQLLAGQSAEASGSELLMHRFMGRVTYI